MITPIGKRLNIQGIRCDEIVLTKPVHSVQDVMLECNCELRQVIKTLLFVGVSVNILAVLNGETRANISLLESLSTQKLRMATPKQVIEITSFPVGAVSPFLEFYPKGLLLLADESIINQEKLFMGSGIPEVVISMDGSEFQKAFKGSFIKMY